MSDQRILIDVIDVEMGVAIIENEKDCQRYLVAWEKIIPASFQPTSIQRHLWNGYGTCPIRLQ